MSRGRKLFAVKKTIFVWGIVQERGQVGGRSADGGLGVMREQGGLVSAGKAEKSEG